MRLLAALTVLSACSSSASERTYTLGELGVERFTLGLPVSGNGKLVVSTSLIAPADWSTVRGVATFSCDDCTLGDDRTPLRNFSWFDNGDVPFGHVTFDTVYGRVELADGRLQLRSQWRSTDLEVVGSVDGTLAKRADDIKLVGCVKFRPTEALRARDPRLYLLFTVTGAVNDDDGWFYIDLEGSVADLHRLARRCETGSLESPTTGARP